MPIFEYHCRGCGEDFETLVRSSGPAPECPSCHTTELDKKLSTFAAVGGGADPAPAMGPCGSCGHPDGPGACHLH